ncbi:hypothetical protein, partial [Brevundimonas sp.]
MSATIVSAGGRGPDRRRRLVVLGGSLAFHAAVLTLIGHELVQTPLTPNPTIDQMPVFIELEPRPLLPGEVARRPARAAESARDTQPLNAARTAPAAAARMATD